ncbi:hypothetical protein ACGFX4_39995 [Kitasatospora sp. NPDC048365]|uniref:hypothetical protein n=1 Tax=Kitasatospora sp. NPDC048365 TaxID=3364050 RepID=UPI003713C03B
MRKNSSLRARTAAVLVAGLLAGGVLAAPAALAAEPAKQYLGTTVPPSVGLGGRSVSSVSAISNPGTEVLKAQLKVTVDIGFQAPAGWLTVDWFDNATKSVKPVPLTFANGVYSGTVPTTVTVQPGQFEGLELLIGTPLGGPQHGATNGGIEQVKLRTAVVAEGTTKPLGEVEKTIPVRGISSSLSGVPGRAVVGGAPIEFDVVAANDSESDYDQLSEILYTAPGSRVELRGADGTWKAAPVVKADLSDEQWVASRIEGPGAFLSGEKSVTRHVRVSYPAGTPLGATGIGHCAIVNGRADQPLVGTTMCGGQAKVTVVAAPAPTTPAPTTPAPATTAPATPAPATTAAAAPVTGALQGDGQRLAETGPRGAGIVAGIGGALLVAGGGVLWFGRRRSA